MASRSFFFYGTLLNPDVREALIKSSPPRPGVLRGFRRVRTRGTPYPGLVARAGAAVRGIVVDDVGTAAEAALRRYEGAGYAARERPIHLDVGGIAWALVFFTRRALPLDDAAWIPRSG